MTGARTSSHSNLSMVSPPEFESVTAGTLVSPKADVLAVTTIPQEASGTARKAPGGSESTEPSRYAPEIATVAVKQQDMTAPETGRGEAELSSRLNFNSRSDADVRRTTGTIVSPECNFSVSAPSGPGKVAAALNDVPRRDGVVATPSSSPPFPIAASAEELSESQHQKASEQQAEPCGREDEVSLGRVSLSMHGTPINSAPTTVADELIKDFGISKSPSSSQFGTRPASQNSVIAKDGRDAPALSGRTSLDLPAASSGVAGLSAAIDAFMADPKFIGVDFGAGDDVTVEAVVVRDSRNVITFRTIAPSESISNSTSLVKA